MSKLSNAIELPNCATDAANHQAVVKIFHLIEESYPATAEKIPSPIADILRLIEQGHDRVAKRNHPSYLGVQFKASEEQLWQDTLLKINEEATSAINSNKSYGNTFPLSVLFKLSQDTITLLADIVETIKDKDQSKLSNTMPKQHVMTA